MKKFLSLVMVLAMTVSLVTVGAGAKDFTDSSKVAYKEAVDVVSACSIIDGYNDGSFNPAGTLTRGAAAKIICNMILGPTTAGALGVTEKPFKDVDTNNVFAGYIAYCSSQGIISGYADGNFRPAGTLTGYAFLKMLLGALGYDAAIEQYTGSNWAVNVAKQAVNLKLTKSNDSFVGTKSVTREEACLYAFNTLLATMVEYENKGTQITINGATIATGASKATQVAQGTYSDTMRNTGLQFAEKFFGKLRNVSSSEDGVGGRYFTYNSKQVSDFAGTDSILNTVYGGTSYSALTTKSDKDYAGYEANTDVDGNVDVDVYYNGTLTSGSTTPTTATALGMVGSRGIVTSFVDNNDDGKFDSVSIIEKYVDKVTGTVKTSTSGAVTNVTIPGVLTSTNVDDVDYPADLAKNDYVLVYVSNGTTHIEKAQTVVGTLTSTTGTDKVTISGTTYKASALKSNSLAGTALNLATMASAVKGQLSCTFVLDNNGNVAYYEKGSSIVSLTNTLFVTAAGTTAPYSGSSDLTYKADVVLMDGTKKTIEVTQTASATGTLTDVDGIVDGEASIADGKLATNVFYTFTESNGVYSLTAVAAADQDFVADGSLVKNASLAQGYKTTSSTAYVYNKVGKTAYTLYTGVANAPAVKTDGTVPMAVLADSDGYALAVVAIGATLDTVTAVSDYDVLFVTSDTTTVYKTDGTVDYYYVTGLVNGDVNSEITVSAANTVAKGGLYQVSAYDNGKVQTVVNTLITTDAAKSTTYVGSMAVMNGNLSFSYTNASDASVSKSFTMASDVTCYVYDASAATITAVDAADLDGMDEVLQVQTIAKSATDTTVVAVYVTVA